MNLSLCCLFQCQKADELLNERGLFFISQAWEKKICNLFFIHFIQAIFEKNGDFYWRKRSVKLLIGQDIEKKCTWLERRLDNQAGKACLLEVMLECKEAFAPTDKVKSPILVLLNNGWM